MKKLLLMTALVMMATPAMAKDYLIKEISDPTGEKPYRFEPNDLRIQPGDTVTFINTQDDTHDVMFVKVPKTVNDMIMSPMMNKEGDKWSYTFTKQGTYQYHCHPHEAAGMKGSIIVGQPSMPDDMKTVDHEAMEQHMGGMEHMEHMNDTGHMMEHMDEMPMMGDHHAMMDTHGSMHSGHMSLKPVDPQYICMVNNAVFEKPQIPVEVNGKTYYGCCTMCKSTLENDASSREAVDPVSGNKVDKATATIGTSEDGKVYYFENEDNLKKFEE